METIANKLKTTAEAKENIQNSLKGFGLDLTETAFVNWGNAITEGVKPGNFTGHVDVEGLTILGYNEEEIEMFQSMVFWNEEEDAYYSIPEWNLAEAGKTTQTGLRNDVFFLPKSAIEGVTNIATGGTYFNRYDSLILFVSSDVETIGGYGFGYNYRLSGFKSKKPITSIASTGFQYAPLPSFDFSEVTSIGDYAFTESRISSLIAPKLLTIGRNAFVSNYGLREMVTPSLEYMAEYVLSGCFSLVKIDLTGVSAVPGLGGSVNPYNVHEECKVYIPAALETEFRASGWADSREGRDWFVVV